MEYKVGMVEEALECYSRCDKCGEKRTRTEEADICYDCKGSIMYIINKTRKEYCRVILKEFDIAQFLELFKNDWGIDDEIVREFGGGLSLDLCEFKCLYY
jgi:hypothetical protein